MSRENLEIVRRYIDALNTGGVDAVEQFWHENIEMSDPVGVPDFDRYIGKPAVGARLESYREFGWDGQLHVQELIDGGDEIVIVWRLVGRAPLSDVPIDVVVVFAFVLDDGKVRRMRQYLSKDDALKAVGLAE